MHLAGQKVHGGSGVGKGLGVRKIADTLKGWGRHGYSWTLSQKKCLLTSTEIEICKAIVRGLMGKDVALVIGYDGLIQR